MPTQLEYNVTKQNERKLYAKFNLLNFKFQKVDEISGVVLSDSWSISATSDIRKSATITLTPDDESSYKIQSGSKIWLDKYIQPYMGIEDIISGEIVYTPMGIFMINNPSQVYSSVDNTITLQLIDLMAKMTGLRNGSLDGYKHIVEEDTDIKEAIIGILKECGFNNYIINIQEEDYQKMPIEISVDENGTFYDLLKKINEVNVNYQMYFDINGVFHYEKIPDGVYEQVLIDDDIWQDTYISHSVNTDYESLKNDIIVIGKTHDIKHYGGEATVSGNTYIATASSVTKLRNNLKVGFVSKQSVENPSLNLNSYGAYPIKNEDGTSPTTSEEETYYVVKFKEDEENPENNYWFFMGELQPRYEIKENNPYSPFYIKGTVGEIKIVLNGGEYDNINTIDLARQRAEWELYTRCRLLDNITITCVPIYWADVNTVIQITLPNEEKPEKYIIKQINITGGISGTQTIQASKYYSFYEFEKYDKSWGYLEENLITWEYLEDKHYTWENIENNGVVIE